MHAEKATGRVLQPAAVRVVLALFVAAELQNGVELAHGFGAAPHTVLVTARGPRRHITFQITRVVAATERGGQGPKIGPAQARGPVRGPLNRAPAIRSQSNG